MSAAVEELEGKADEVATLLRAIANENRLLILCRLVTSREESVGRLAEMVGLSQSALSQHLARMRAEGLVTFRRDGQTLWYRIADPRLERLFAAMHEIFCDDAANARRKLRARARP